MDTPRTDTEPAQSSPTWYHSYFSAILETNQNRAVVKIERARTSVQNRIIELQFGKTPTQAREIQDLNNALTYLQILLEHIGKESDGLLWE